MDGTPVHSPEQARLVRRILRVNHAGEHGAIAIYKAQRQAAWRYPEFRAWIDETLAHEEAHRAAFRAAMASRAARPCGGLIVWSAGGTLLGWITGLLGRSGLMICTAAVERAVHRHLDAQIAYLEGRDNALAAIIRDIQREEQAHLAFAEDHHHAGGVFATILDGVVTAATETMIWLSTRGDSRRLAQTVRDAGENEVQKS